MHQEQLKTENMQKIINYTIQMINSQVGKTICFLLIFIFIHHVTVHAQPDQPIDADAPVDGGLSLLVAGGIGYGVKKVKEARKRK